MRIRLFYKEYWFPVIYTVSTSAWLCYWSCEVPGEVWSKIGFSRNSKTFIIPKLPSYNRPRDLSPSVSQLFLQLHQLRLFFRRPFFAFDRAIQMVVVSLTALFATSILYFELFVQNPGYFCPLFDTSCLINFFQRFVFLNGINLTAAVQAFLSLIFLIKYKCFLCYLCIKIEFDL